MAGDDKADDGAKAADAAGADVTKAAAEGLKKALDVLAPEPKADEPPAPKGPVDEVFGAIGSADITTSATQAAKAAERYRNAMRWLVAAVAAVGTALFGSAAFTTGDPFATATGRVGLGLAGVGLVLILLAATLVFEPEDASLGELADDFATTSRWWRKGFWWAQPKWAALRRLEKIVQRSETEAHLGPGRATVTDLMDGLADGQRTRVETAKAVARAHRLVEQVVEERKGAEALLKAMVGARAAAVGTATGGAIDGRIAMATYDLARAASAERDARVRLRTEQDRLAYYDHQLGIDVLHRSLLLDESVVAQLRGTFRMSRLLLLAGAVLTLVGTVAYLTAVKGDESVVRAGTVTVTAGSAAAKELDEDCVGVELRVLLFGEEAASVGDELEVTVTDPSPCRGTVTFPAGWTARDIDLAIGLGVDVPGAGAGG